MGLNGGQIPSKRRYNRRYRPSTASGPVTADQSPGSKDSAPPAAPGAVAVKAPIQQLTRRQRSVRTMARHMFGQNVG